MAVVLLQLKLAVQRRSLGRGGAGQRALYLAGWVLGLLLGLAVGAVVEVLASARDGLGDLGLVLLLSAVFLGWLLSPLLLPGMNDDTVDPQRLEQFPISARDQVAGLLLGSLVAPTALFTFLAAAGGTFAPGETIPQRFAVGAAAAVFAVLCVAAGRAVQAVLSSAMRSRRARDLMIGTGAVIAVAAYLLARSARDAGSILVGLESPAVETALSWLPPGAAAAAMIALRDAAWGPAALHLLVAVLGLAAALAAWTWAIRRRVRGPRGRAHRHPASRSTETRLALVPLPLAAIGSGPVVAAAAQQLRYLFFRQPRAMQAVVMLPIIGAVMAHSTIAAGDLTTGVVLFVTMCLVSVVFNYFGYDDAGVAYLLAAGAPLRLVLRGKALAALVLILPAAAALIAVEATLARSWNEALPALLAGADVAAIGVGIGAVVSVWTPQNRARAGVGHRGLVLFGTLTGVALLFVAVGLLLAVWTIGGDADPLLLTAVPLPVAAAVGWLLLSRAGARLQRHPWHLQRMLLD